MDATEDVASQLPLSTVWSTRVSSVEGALQPGASRAGHEGDVLPGR